MFYLRLHMYGRLRLFFYALALFSMKHLEPRSNYHDRSRPIVEKTLHGKRNFFVEYIKWNVMLKRRIRREAYHPCRIWLMVLDDHIF